MIRTIFARKSLYWFMIAITGGSVLFSLVPGMITSLMNNSNVIGSVNGLPIPLYEYRAELAKEHRLLAAYREQFGPNYQKVLSYLGKSENVEQSAQEQIISSKLLLAMAQAIPVYLHTGYIARELAQQRTVFAILGEAIPSHYLFNQQGALKLDVLHRFLKSQGLTIEQFEELAESLLKSQWGLKLSYGAVTASKSGEELFNRINFYHRNFTIETIDLSSLLTEEKLKAVPDQEVTEFYEKHRTSSAYWSPERRNGTMWSFDLAKFSPEEGAKDPESQRNHFTELAQQLVLLGDENAFKQFSEMYHGQSSSLVKMIKPKGDAQDVDPLLVALFSSGKVGDRTVTTKGNKGYIVEITEIVPPQKLDFEIVREKVIEDMYRSRAQARGLELIAVPDQEVTEFYEKHRTSSAYWSPERRNGTMQQLVWLGASPSRDAQDVDPLLVALFSSGKVGDRTVITKGNKEYIVEITEIVLPQKLDFEIVREKVIEDMYRSRAQARGLELIKAGSAAHRKIQSFALAPHAKAVPEVLSAAGLSLAATLDGLIMLGNTTEGANEGVAYRITVVGSEPDLKARDALGNDGGCYIRNFTIETIDLSSLLTEEKLKAVPDQEVTEFYEKHKTSSAYWSPERRNGTMWSFDLAKFSPEERNHFTELAQQLVLLGDENAFKQLSEMYHGQSSLLVKMIKPKGDAQDVDQLLVALFSSGKVGDRTVTTKDNKKYTLEITEIVPPQKLDFEIVREKVIEDMYRSGDQTRGLKLIKAGSVAHRKIQSFALAPHAKAVPEVLSAAGLSLATLDGLIMPGNTTEGANEGVAYRITVVGSEPDLKARDALGNDGARRKKIYEEAGELMLRNLIASLRSRAIIMIRTETETR